MTVSPAAGVAPLNVAAAPQPQASTSLHAVLAGGANLGGGASTSESYGLPSMPGVGTAVAGVAGTTGATAPAPQAATTGGGAQAAQGAASLDASQLVPAIQQVISAVNNLIAALQAQGGGAVTGGGAPASGVGGCGMAGCTMDHGVTQAAAGAQGASGAPDAASGEQQVKKEKKKPAAAAPAPAPGGGQAPQSYSGREPRRLSGETSYSGLNDKSFRLLEAAHKHDLKLISGHRPGDSGSGHSNGSAVDVANVKGGSRQGSPQMRAYAEEIRAAGRAGDPNVGYVIYQQQIASAKSNWEWRDMEDRGSNTQNHFDHVHVSSDPKL